MKQNTKKHKRLLTQKIALITIIAVFLTVVVVVGAIGFSSRNDPNPIDSWDALRTQPHESYLVYFYHPDNRYEPVLRPFLEDYHEQAKTRPIYTINALSVSDSPDFDFREGRGNQLIIIKDGQVDGIVQGLHAIATVLSLPEAEALNTYKEDHLHHWLDKQFYMEDMFFIFLYQEGDRYEDIKPRYESLREGNRMGISIYTMDAQNAHGIPNTIREPMELFGIPLGHRFTNPTVAVIQEGELVMVEKGLEAVNSLFDQVEAGTFEVIKQDFDDEDDESEIIPDEE